MGNPVALEASAEERHARIHLDDDHPAIRRMTANCTLDPPVRADLAHRDRASRMI